MTAEDSMVDLKAKEPPNNPRSLLAPNPGMLQGEVLPAAFLVLYVPAFSPGNTAPTPHSRAENGGRYPWTTTSRRHSISCPTWMAGRMRSSVLLYIMPGGVSCYTFRTHGGLCCRISFNRGAGLIVPMDLYF